MWNDWPGGPDGRDTEVATAEEVMMVTVQCGGDDDDDSCRR